MAHFGFISPPVQGHINPMCALGRELQSRGHRATYFQVPDLADRIRGEGLEFHPIGMGEYPIGSLGASFTALGKLKGLAALRFTIRAVARTTSMTCRDLPDAARRAGVDAFIVDQMEPAGGAVAEHLGLPFVTVCNALPINRDPSVPPPFTPWRYERSTWTRVRNRTGYAVSDALTRPILQAVADYRRNWRLAPLGSQDDSFSKRLQISQMPRGLDFPREDLPPTFHYVGPIRRPGSAAPPFPWERLNGRPHIYASLGTLQNSREPVFRCIAEACRDLPVQLVISHGGGLSDAQAAALPGSPVVVQYAPQPDVIAGAALTITHAGLNTVLDSLSQGVPLVVMPITYEQPAIGRRVERVGAGRMLALDAARPERLRGTVREVLERQSFRQAASQVATDIRQAGGVAAAGDLIEAATVGRPG